MSSENKDEREVKLYINDLKAVEERLRGLGAALFQAREHELNLRFDTPQRDFARSFRVIRLRQSSDARLTYKGPAHFEEELMVRPEIEFTIGDFEAARAFMEAIGLEVSMVYEKFRTMYRMQETLIDLDELPYGDFIEMEGSDTQYIQQICLQLGLNIKASIREGYITLFERLRERKGFSFRDLTFENFKGLRMTAEDLEVIPADG